MHIVHIASEIAPIAKVGGLADVVHGLCRELIAQGHRVEIILPYYASLDKKKLQNLYPIGQVASLSQAGRRDHNGIFSAVLENTLPLFLIEPLPPRNDFARNDIYGFPDDVERFFYFSRSCLEFLMQKGIQPDVLHLHDWPTGWVAALYKELYVPLGYKKPKILLTLHNLEHQGKTSLAHAIQMGFTHTQILHHFQDPYIPDTINTLRGAIHYADFLTTVSPTYEKEIKTPEGGAGLHLLLQDCQNKLRGILNGIDAAAWDPTNDPYLHPCYPPAGDLPFLLKAKQANKRHIQNLLQLAHSDKPLVASITRLAHQKGPELIEHALSRTLEQGGQYVLLGSYPAPDLLPRFQALQKQFQRHPDCFISLEKSDTLAHLLFAAADMIVIPSLFEPCGLTQLIALRYGTLPIARRTGGLADTVFDCETATIPFEQRNGFTFDFPDKQGIVWALDRALHTFRSHPDLWHTLMRHALLPDRTWHSPTLAYTHLYNTLLSLT